MVTSQVTYLPIDFDDCGLDLLPIDVIVRALESLMVSLSRPILMDDRVYNRSVGSPNIVGLIQVQPHGVLLVPRMHFIRRTGLHHGGSRNELSLSSYLVHIVHINVQRARILMIIIFICVYILEHIVLTNLDVIGTLVFYTNVRQVHVYIHRLSRFCLLLKYSLFY